MKKVLVKGLSWLMMLTMLLVMGGCISSDGSVNEETQEVQVEGEVEDEPVVIEKEPLSGDLVVWSFSNELLVHAIAFQEAHSDVNIEFAFFSSEEFSRNVIAAADTADCPDVVGLEAGDVKTFVESDMLLDLSDLLPLAESVGAYQYTIDIGTDFESGEVRAYAYEAMPGAVFYRRSLAQEFFGTDDPAEIQAMMESMDDYLDMGRTIREESGGTVFLLSSISELSSAFNANRTSPWVVDNQLVIDPIIEEFFDAARTIRTEGLDAQVSRWFPEWYSSMNDGWVDPATGQQRYIFSYFLPISLLPYVLATNATDTAGDWAVVPGPLPYSSGGSWLGVMNNASNPDNAREFIAFATMNEDHLENWALGVYTEEYLINISPELASMFEYQYHPLPGSFVNSSVVAERLIPAFVDAEMSNFLGGQNFYAFLNEAGPKVSAVARQSNDDFIQMLLDDILTSYASGEEYADYEEAINRFRATVTSNMDIT